MIDDTIATTLPTQLVTAADGFGLAVLFASLLVYALMLLAVKPFLETWAADRGKTSVQRSRITMSASLLPGLVAAFLVDFEPIAQAFGVKVDWMAIPSGAVFYALGGVLVHNVIRRLDPLGKIEERIFGRDRGQLDDELDARLDAHHKGRE